MMGGITVGRGRRETRAEEIARLQREIAERQARLHHLVLGDQTKCVSGSSIESMWRNAVSLKTKRDYLDKCVKAWNDADQECARYYVLWRSTCAKRLRLAIE